MIGKFLCWAALIALTVLPILFRSYRIQRFSVVVLLIAAYGLLWHGTRLAARNAPLPDRALLSSQATYADAWNDGRLATQAVADAYLVPLQTIFIALGILALVPVFKMSKYPSIRNVACSLSLALILTGCMDSDPFGLSIRRIIGDYKLEQFESGHYYLLKNGVQGSGGGFLDGIVLELGWDASIIAAKRYSTFRGDPDGWMFIDLATGATTGPFTDDEFRKRYPLLKTAEAKSAWQNL